MVQELWPPKLESNHRHKDFISHNLAVVSHVADRSG
jgi:hypothetical protein